MGGITKTAMAGVSGLFLSACATTDTPKSRDQIAPRYERTPFTLSLIGEAPRMGRDTLKPDFNNATDLAYCAVITGDDVRSGKQPFVERLRVLVSDEQRVQSLLTDAARFEGAAINYAQTSDNAATAMYYNFGGHAEACKREINLELANPADCEEALKKNPVPAGLRHTNTYETSLTYDGRYLAKLVRGQAHNIITVFDLQAKTRREIELSDTRFELKAPSISGNGKWIAVQATHNHFNIAGLPNRLLIIPVDGGPAAYISSESDHYGPPAMSPRGDRVFYGKLDTGYRVQIVNGASKRVYDRNLQSPGRGRSLYERDLATGKEQRLSDQTFERVLDPVYAPDGRGVVFRFMEPIHPDGLAAQLSSKPQGVSYGGNYWTYFTFGTELPLWPESVAPLDGGYFSSFGPDGSLYGYDFDRLSTTDPTTGEKTYGFRIWRKAPGAEEIEIIDQFDKPQPKSISSAAGGALLPETSTLVSLALRKLRCFEPGARKYSDPFLSINRRGVAEYIALDDFPATRVHVVLPEQDK